MAECTLYALRANARVLLDTLATTDLPAGAVIVWSLAVFALLFAWLKNAWPERAAG